MIKIENPSDELTPREVVELLDKYIIGQSEAKRAVAISLRNRIRRRKIDVELQEEISPKNIIMMGPTGVGKTEIARRLSKLVKAPFIKVEITKYTEVGYIGRDVESMIRDLVSTSITMVKKEFTKAVEEQAKHNAENRILSILLGESNGSENTGFSFPGLSKNSGKEIEISDDVREHYREQLRTGKLDDREIEYEVKSSMSMPVMSVMGGPGMDDMDMQLQDMFGDILPKTNKKKKNTVKTALEYFEEEEAEQLLDLDLVNTEAIRRVEEMGIVFIDEIDKIAGGESKSGPDVSRQGVQRDLLPLVEGTIVNTKYGAVKTDHILFIAAGAFSISRPEDLVPELQGRFPVQVELNSLTEEDLKLILTQPKHSICEQYIELLKTEGVNLHFSEDGISEIAYVAKHQNAEQENIGARRLHTVMELLLDDILFDAPDYSEEQKDISIDKKYVSEKMNSSLEKRDLQRYIL